MSLGDKAVAIGCALIAAGWAGYELRDREVAPLQCSARLEDGRALANFYVQADGRLLCEYVAPMPTHRKGKHGWT